MRRLIIIFSLAGILFGAALVSYLRVSAQELRDEIRTSLPLGSSRTQVNNFLWSHGMGEYIAAFDYPTGHPLQGMILVNKSGLLFSHDMYVAFYFDKAQNLCRYEVSEKPFIANPRVIA